MGVYLPNMKMPTSCDSRRIMTLEDTNCIPELYCGCPIVFKAHPQGVGHRPDYCPLVEIPPHGRLIDADELRELYEEWENDKEAGIDIDKCHVPIPVIRQNIDDAPTVIPAEGE